MLSVPAFAGCPSTEMMEMGIQSTDYAFFTIQPGGQIPNYNHFYHQTMYIISGEFECWEFDSETDETKQKIGCGPGTSIYISSTEPHGMKNTSDGPSTFLCCICNVYDNDDVI